jgi:hypothetical protein
MWQPHMRHHPHDRRNHNQSNIIAVVIINEEKLLAVRYCGDA